LGITIWALVISIPTLDVGREISALDSLYFGASSGPVESPAFRYGLEQSKILRIFCSFFLEKNEPRKARQRKSVDLPGFHFTKRFIPLASLGKSFAAACAAAAPFKRQVPSLFQGAFLFLLNR